jgi:hypothetical protein
LYTHLRHFPEVDVLAELVHMLYLNTRRKENSVEENLETPNDPWGFSFQE